MNIIIFDERIETGNFIIDTQTVHGLHYASVSIHTYNNYINKLLQNLIILLLRTICRDDNNI